MLFVVALLSSQAVWKAAEHDAAMAGCKSYTAAVNLMWCAVRRLITPGVPITEGAINVMIQTHWAAGPTKFPGELCIGLLRGSHSASDFKSQIGNLMRLSPEEFDHSLLIHIGDRIKAGAEQHELEQRVRRLAEDSTRDYTAASQHVLKRTFKVLENDPLDCVMQDSSLRFHGRCSVPQHQ